MDKMRAFFERKKMNDGAIRLIWRNPAAHSAAKRAAVSIGAELPNSMTLGRYERLDEDGEPWCWIPNTTPVVLEMMQLENVQQAITRQMLTVIEKARE